MSQLQTYTSVNDGASARRYSGYPLNSTLVSSYTPDTIRSIISHAAAGQPYSTAVWLRINRVGIQINAQDAQIARTRVPVFIPIGLVHDIYMLPNINNVVCIVYDELQSNMKGVLLYVVHPSDAQLLRDDFRIVKQANNNQQLPPAPYSSPFDNRFSKTGEIFPPGTNRNFPPITSNKSPLSNELYRNTVTIRHASPKRVVYVRDNDALSNRNITPTTTETGYAPSKSSNNNGKEDSSHRRNKSPKRNPVGNSSGKRSSDSGTKRRKHRSRSPERQGKTKLPVTNSSHELSQEQIRQQQEILLQQQQQQWALQQQQMAAWQASQQASMVPIGIYNRYVPKTIPLPTGETLKTTLPATGSNGATLNGVAVAYIEPQQTQTTTKDSNVIASRSSTNQNTTPAVAPTTQPPRPHQRRAPVNDQTTNAISKPDTNAHASSQSSRSRSKHLPSKDNTKSVDKDDETKQYLKMLIDEMQAMKIEMNKMRQSTVGGTKGRSDSLQGDLREIRSHIDHIRSRMAATPKIPENIN
ncbi:unnamed protein product [Rotaria socialis]|uniref:Uncharacterized protein n=1 Tax=Rotaria socialis TaxID=392032 RepID=A0A820FVH2_9BILA|nr:unnamed protein product [Rotaria socialis]CAF3433213.1 unnamed protein product [Rotaria socialis]CAF3452097.1 unnamed protein product [Rotaria socialis]CAF3463393.1 unnamed protein product [Rotaria socialis]CAF3607053.1 unnamed protein product [Rotaria socialis]